MVRSQLSKISFFQVGNLFEIGKQEVLQNTQKNLNYLERDLIDICNILQWFLWYIVVISLVRVDVLQEFVFSVNV